MNISHLHCSLWQTIVLIAVMANIFSSVPDLLKSQHIQGCRSYLLPIQARSGFSHKSCQIKTTLPSSDRRLATSSSHPQPRVQNHHRAVAPSASRIGRAIAQLLSTHRRASSRPPYSAKQAARRQATTLRSASGPISEQTSR
jgi:hypothetical protein